MTTPSEELVTNWRDAFASDLVKVEVGTAEVVDDYWKVTPASGEPVIFYGERAWIDSRRYALTIDPNTFF